jgi:hypothetical protein
VDGWENCGFAKGLAMRVQVNSILGEPFECAAMVTNRHPWASFGQAVLVLLGPEGGAVGPAEAEFAGYEVVEASEEERRGLVEAGYRLKGLETGVVQGVLW